MCPAHAGRLVRWLVQASLAFVLIITVAQDTGQICLLAFVDRDEDGRRTESEAPLTRGVVASLLDERGVTIRSRLLEDSPYAAEGLLCFEELLAGKYGVIASSSEYNATTSTAAEATVRPGAPPARIDFGAKPLTAEILPGVLTGLAALGDNAVQSLLVAGGAFAALTIMLSMLGTLIFALIMRRRRRAPVSAPPGGDMPVAERAIHQAPAPPRRHAPGQGSPPVFSDQGEDW